MSKLALAALGLLLIAGCAESDPYRRQGMWQPEGANAANLAAMVQRPADLLRGRGDASPDRRQAADAVKRLWEDRERAWPNKASSSSSMTPSSQKEGS